MKQVRKRKGKVYLVGAGPGDVGLITLRGVELLKAADCVIYDRLVNPAVLRYVREEAEIIYTPKRTGAETFKQERINELLVQKAAEVETVVRLKGGDPCIFGRGTEEAAALAEAGVDFEIVPGITAGIAAAEYAGIILSDRRYSSQVVFVTGREAEDKGQSGIDWKWLAKFDGTIVFYMGVGNLGFIAERLIENGMSEDKPAAVISEATLPSQKVVRSSLEALPGESRAAGIQPPAIIIIGEAARGDLRLDWFESKALFGQRIVVTRDGTGNLDFAAKINKRGGAAVCFETIFIKPSTSSSQFLKAVSQLSEYDWIVFTSAKGVRIFFDWLCSLGKDGRVFGSARMAVIGNRTAEKLAEFGIKADFVPGSFTSSQLGKGLLGFANREGRKMLLLRSEQASAELAEILQKGGAEVTETSVYTVEPRRSDADSLKDKIKSNEIDWVTFASPSSVRSFFDQVDKDLIDSSEVKVASIGPVTSGQLKTLGVKVDLEASVHNIEGLLEGIESFVKPDGVSK